MEHLNGKIIKTLIVSIILFSLAFAGTVFSEPYFSIDNPIQWEEVLLNGSVRPVDETEWNEYMFQWDQFLVEGEPYPNNQFFSPELYVYGGGDDGTDISDGGLVMMWGDDDLPDSGSFSSAWIYDYGVDPDLTNCTITLTVLAPQFDAQTNSQINAVSFGMKDMNGNVRGWNWTCGAAGSGASIIWNVSTTVTINTSLTGINAATPTASGYMNTPGFDITKVLILIVDENASWNWLPNQASVPAPGTTIQRPWNLWADLSVSKNPTNPINAGINIDVHQNNPDIIANDFHIQGRIESGLINGNWGDPPVLLEHIDGQDPFKFPKFTYTITPDKNDPSGNWYNFTANWSGIDVPFCTVIHLGLLFDVTCHNIIIDLYGWWTRDGEQISMDPILGFDVQDGLTTGFDQQTVTFQNTEIPIEFVAMDLVSLPPGTKIPFDQLRAGTPFVDPLPWIPLANEQGPINPDNPFHIDSFFDVFIELNIPGQSFEPGMLVLTEPIRIEPGGFLIMRQNAPFIDRDGTQQDRWFFEIHEAHDGAESDLGDAPDKTNTYGTTMTAYPAGGPAGVTAHYPTVYNAGSPPHGPIHRRPAAVAHLGRSVTGEFEADTGPDVDPTNNIIPSSDKPNLDYADDGVLGLPFTLTSCKLMKFNYLVNVIAPSNVLYANVWFDWNRDGDWDDSFNCSSTSGTLVTAPEWAVQNQQFIGLPLGLNTVTSLPFRPYQGFDAAGNEIPEDHPIWMRITLSGQKWSPNVLGPILGDGGSGLPGGYQIGETEDYYFVPKKTCIKDPDLDCSGFVDIKDFAIMARKWLQPVP